MNDASPSVDPTSLARPRRSERRFWAVWAILVGSLIVAGVASHLLSQVWWFALVLFLYFGAFKVAALIALSSAERQQFTPGRLLAYFLWIGVQPRPFLLSYVPPSSAPRPTWQGFLLNAATGATILWGVSYLLPDGTPLLLRAWVGLIGWSMLRLFAGFDGVALLYRWLGFPVEKPFFNPTAATSLGDFWGRRWNRFMSGLMRDMLFVPLTRRVGAVAAALAVFLYSGVLHEFVSILADSGYGRPTLYFLIQGVAFLVEGTHPCRRWLLWSPVVCRCWTALVVIGPIALVVPPDFLYDVIVPVLREMYVPGLSSGE
ncbi:MAG: hypothetical protein FJ271_30830 [Planctomycetes bacterium]|nr:hypothetical protein [Planctomycetota bacterium]